MDYERGKTGNNKGSREGDDNPVRQADPEDGSGIRRQVPGDGKTEQQDINGPDP